MCVCVCVCKLCMVRVLPEKIYNNHSMIRYNLITHFWIKGSTVASLFNAENALDPSDNLV